MRNSVTRAILVCKKDINEKDMLLEFVTADLGYIKARDYSSQSKGSKSFMLYSTGSIYLYKPETSDTYTLQDSKLEKNRLKVLQAENMLKLAALCQCAKYFSRFIADAIFPKIESALDFIEESADFNKVFIYTIQSLLQSLHGSVDYTHCPVCSRKYNDDEILGYSRELFIPVCQDCGCIRQVLLPGVRRYLGYTQNMTIDNMLKVDINPDALKNVLKYTKFQLQTINPTGFRALEFI